MKSLTVEKLISPFFETSLTCTIVTNATVRVSNGTKFKMGDAETTLVGRWKDRCHGGAGPTGLEAIGRWADPRAEPWADPQDEPWADPRADPWAISPSPNPGWGDCAPGDTDRPAAGTTSKPICERGFPGMKSRTSSTQLV
jgi:hypothetical protein